MSWITWAAVLIAWPLVGLAVAYLFGRFTQRGEVYGGAAELSPPVVSYLRRARREKALSRAVAQAKPRREAAGGRSVH
jgi:deoxyinosine 3'endonuclease (endonuclease V)